MGERNKTTTNNNQLQPRRQGLYWIATISKEDWIPTLTPGIVWAKGQLERGESGYEHWQFVFGLPKKGSMATVKEIFRRADGRDVGHFELTRSNNAEQYCWKDETSLGERFELGERPIKRNDSLD